MTKGMDTEGVENWHYSWNLLPWVNCNLGEAWHTEKNIV